ncbi:TetR/AcrR family transcriptional regulator [Georgenia thermotolerans]|uniref:TetR family transcriptional regulator n=1 Tax=Georgenia thermotolerans TaxID=527326 RepID=A0A7J5UM52_9MICO|nr:TetR/AcrR family transcriptional regulator [Georgenia thermotolerans]KAE8763442.1 TetR family transcriptional regulator [Georgenia thermotolerans]
MTATETTVNEAREMGLRELKKQMTREALADAALRLTGEKGLDNVTIEEIARAAIVSPRTFSNYFSCKEEAVVTAGAADPAVLVAAFLAVADAEPPLKALCQVLSDHASSRTDEQLRVIVEKLELVQRYPSLLPFQSAQYDRLEEGLRGAVAKKTGTQPDTDVYPWLVAAAAVSCLRSALQLWARAGDDAGRLAPFIQDAFNQVSAGLPVPRR